MITRFIFVLTFVFVSSVSIDVSKCFLLVWYDEEESLNLMKSPTDNYTLLRKPRKMKEGECFVSVIGEKVEKLKKKLLLFS